MSVQRFDNITEVTGRGPKRIEDALNSVERGIINTIGEVTLATGAASTTVTAYWCSSTSCVLLMPLDATTALEYGLGTTWVAPTKGSFVISHPNNGTTRRYRYVFFGGIRQ